MTFHRWVIFSRVPDYLRLGWLALPTLDGTGHGIYSAHCVWPCSCRMVEPPSEAEIDNWKESIENGPFYKRPASVSDMTKDRKSKE